MIDQCRNEIKELHEFFQQWFQATIPNTDSEFGRVEAALHPDFVLITPDGSCRGRAELLASIRQAYGLRRGLRIWTTDIAPTFTDSNMTILTYVEWQSGDGKENRRLSSAVFQHDAAAPNGILWLHVHETGLSPGSTPRSL